MKGRPPQLRRREETREKSRGGKKIETPLKGKSLSPDRYIWARKEAKESKR